MSEPLKDYLLQGGHLTEEEFEKAQQKALASDISIINAIEVMNFLDARTYLDVFSKYFRVPAVDLSEKEISREITALLPREFSIKHKVVPIDRAGNNIIVAMNNPRDLDAINGIRFSAGFFPKPVFASSELIEQAIKKYYGGVLDLKIINKTTGQDGDSPTVEARERQEIAAAAKDDGPIIRLVNQILIECLQRKASDIHIEPYETYLRVRLRIDGSLHEIVRPPSSAKAALTSRIKIMSELDIAETRVPQDGAINITIGGKPVDFRVSTVPTMYGEKIVMRILDKSNLQVDMTQLGFETDELEKFKSAIHSPFGMVLVTGPTGSGKTTTLYSALQDLNTEDDNIMTAEDPVEYNLEGINQVQMKNSVGLNFASALKAFLRQDPDIIMVGEIRDLETAEIAIKAALTGHMVLSTLHTNSAPETISRLLNMGVEGFNLVSALQCITAQRLMRKICDRCRVIDESVTPETMIQLGIPERYAAKVRAYKGKGCSDCGNTGSKGRVAVHEVLKLSDPVREGILKGLPAYEIKKIAMVNGMRTLRQSALNKMVLGQATALEVTKKTAPDSSENESSSNAA